MSVTFKCKQTGNTVTFRDEVDIVGMRLHPEYTEVQSTNEVLPEKEQVFLAEEQEQPKRVGRPKKEQ